MFPNLPGIAPEPVEGNSLDKITRSLTNFLSTSGPQLQQTGSDILGAGGKTVESAVSGMGGPLAYWNSLLTGNPLSLTGALAGPAGAMAKANAADLRARESGVLGSRAATESERPFNLAGQIGNLALGTQADAAKNIVSTLASIAGIGTAQQQIGLGEQELSVQELGTALQSLLTRRGQNVQQDNAAMGAIGSGLGSLIGGLLNLIPHTSNVNVNQG